MKECLDCTSSGGMDPMTFVIVIAIFAFGWWAIGKVGTGEPDRRDQ
jgi:hypothetical protein